MLKYQLASVPMEISDRSGVKTKSTLKRLLQVETSNRHMGQDNSLIIDGSIVILVVSWPTNGSVQDYVDKAATWIVRKVEEFDVFMLSDSYINRRADQSWWMPTESFSPKKLHPVSNMFKYYFMIYHLASKKMLEIPDKREQADSIALL